MGKDEMMQKGKWTSTEVMFEVGGGAEGEGESVVSDHSISCWKFHHPTTSTQVPDRVAKGSARTIISHFGKDMLSA